MAKDYSFTFTGDGSQDFLFPADVSLIIASGTWGPAQLDIKLWHDEPVNAYQIIDSWVVADPVPKRSEVRVPVGLKGRLTVTGSSGTNLVVTIKPGTLR